MSIYHISQPTYAKDFLRDKISFPCSGNGVCGKCKIKITGDVSPITDKERELLTSQELATNIRLACYTEIFGECTLETWENTQIIEGLSADAISTENFSVTSDKSTHSATYVCAIDIGTTTIACVVYEAQSGTKVAEVLEENHQRSYGADVISRIEACEEFGVSTLQDVVRNQLHAMYLKSNSSLNYNINQTVITANTTMLHILEGLSPKTLGHAPFHTLSLFGTNTNFLSAYIPHCVSAYVGADLLCAVLASDMTTQSGISLLVDIGTNGEMCIYKNSELICCSVAAGPAFEGCGLSCGSPAIDGAITEIAYDTSSTDSIVINTLGSTPTSICGAGIISIISAFLDWDIIDETGRFTDTEVLELGHLDDQKFYIKNSDVYVSQQDISQVQLAKSAICAGILTLLEETNTSMNEVDTLYICGGFGSHMNIHAACNIGLIPTELESKIKILGNAALTGALEIALGKPEVEPIYSEINLSSSETFMDNYMDCMMFE